MAWRVFDGAGQARVLAAVLMALLAQPGPAAAQQPAPASAPAAAPAPAAVAAPASARGNSPGPTQLDLGFHALYSLQFEKAHAAFDRWMQEHPEDPLGPAAHASGYLFQELNRLGILAAEFLKDDKKLSSGSGARPDPRLRTLFFEEARRAESQANAMLAHNPQHQDSLLALTICQGTQADYLNLVEKRPLASLPLFKKSNKHAQALLKLNPTAYDAWTASGFTEYLAGSLPFYLRWVLRFDSVEGQKSRGVEQLRLAATRGRYLRPFAKILLAVVQLREKRPADAARLLEELRDEFPTNPLFVMELARLNGQPRSGH